MPTGDLPDELLELLGCGCRKRCCCAEAEKEPLSSASNLFQTRQGTRRPPPLPDESPFIPPPPSFDTPQRPSFWGSTEVRPVSSDLGVFGHEGGSPSVLTPNPFPEFFQLADSGTESTSVNGRPYQLIVSTSLTTLTLETTTLPYSPIPRLPWQDVQGIDFFAEELGPFDIVLTDSEPDFFNPPSRVIEQKMFRPLRATLSRVTRATSRWMQRTVDVQGAEVLTPVSPSVVTERAMKAESSLESEDGEAVEVWGWVERLGSSISFRTWRLMGRLPRTPDMRPSATRWVALPIVTDADTWRSWLELGFIVDLDKPNQFATLTTTVDRAPGPLPPAPTAPPFDATVWRTPDSQIIATRASPEAQAEAPEPIKDTLTAYGHEYSGGTWAGLRGPGGAAWMLWEDGGPVTLIRPDGTTAQAARAVFEQRVLRCPVGAFQGFSGAAAGSHSWPPQWAWALCGAEARAVVLWDAWRDSTRLEWPGRPKRRPDPSRPLTLPPTLAPPLGLTLATTGPPPNGPEALRLGQGPGQLPATVQVWDRVAEVWRDSPVALAALSKRFLYPPAGWPEELDDRTSAAIRVRVTAWAGPALPIAGVCAFLIRCRGGKQLPIIDISGQRATLKRLGRSPLERGYQPYLALTTLPYPPTTALTVTSSVPLTRLILTRVPGQGIDPDPNPGGGGST